MKKIHLLFLAVIFYTCGTSAQNVKINVYAGGNFAIGDYSSVVMQNGDVMCWGLKDRSRLGGAGSGVNTGISLNWIAPDFSKLRLFVSADFYYNSLNHALKDYKNRLWVSNSNTYDTYRQRFPVYFNIPVQLGMGCDFYSPVPYITFFAQAGFGANLRIVTHSSEQWNFYNTSSEASTYEETYDPQTSFAYSLGFGVLFFEKLSLELQYVDLGAAEVSSSSSLEYSTPEGDKSIELLEHINGRIHPTMLSLRLGFRF